MRVIYQALPLGMGELFFQRHALLRVVRITVLTSYPQQICANGTELVVEVRRETVYCIIYSCLHDTCAAPLVVILNAATRKSSESLFYLP